MESPAPQEGNRIRVAVRCRPCNPREVSEGAAADAVVEIDQGEVSVAAAGPTASRKTFGYDHAFGPEDTQARVFEAIGLQLLDNALAGYNGCIFAYGQTGSGKSYSIVGDPSSEAEKGVLPCACVRLFEMIEARREADSSFQAMVLASYLEIYNEKLFDLLSQNGGRSGGNDLQVRLHPTLGAIVVNLTECPMQSFGEGGCSLSSSSAGEVLLASSAATLQQRIEVLENIMRAQVAHMEQLLEGLRPARGRGSEGGVARCLRLLDASYDPPCKDEAAPASGSRGGLPVTSPAPQAPLRGYDDGAGLPLSWAPGETLTVNVEGITPDSACSERTQHV